MATLFSLARARPLYFSPSTFLTSRTTTFRSLHVSPITQKSKKARRAASADVDNLFTDSNDTSGDLFTFTSSESTPTSSSASNTSQTGVSSSLHPASANAKLNGRLDPAARAQRFDELFVFVQAHTGRSPTAKDALQVRDSAWKHLFSLATDRAQMERVVAVFAQWREGGRTFKPDMVMAFVRRCEELKCPDLALDVFANRPKYGMDLASPAIGRRLLHALHAHHPLSASVTLGALYGLYRLPSLASDPIACALLLTACLRATTASATPSPPPSSESSSTSPDAPSDAVATQPVAPAKSTAKPARVVANALLPVLRDLLAKTEPMPIDPNGPRKGAGHAGEVVRERVWLKWCLQRIERALVSRGEDAGWVREWRVRSGYVNEEMVGRAAV